MNRLVASAVLTMALGQYSDSPRAEFKPIELPGLTNVLEVRPGIINGSCPMGSLAFDSLALAGVKTIISVDGALPDVQAAKVRGMRYVHLPIGYDGITFDQGCQITRAIRDLPHPLYIHCYHGKNRSPAAAAYAMVALSEFDPGQASGFLKAAGTSGEYVGLYDAVTNAEAISPAALDSIPDQFPSGVTPSRLVECMLNAQKSLDRLRATSKNGWNPPSNDPDVDVNTELQILRETLCAVREATDHSIVRPEFETLLGATETASDVLAEAYKHQDKTAANQSLAALENRCHSCHQSFRDRHRR